MNDNEKQSSQVIENQGIQQHSVQTGENSEEQSEEKNTNEDMELLQSSKAGREAEHGGSNKPFADSELEAASPIRPTNPWTFALNTGLFAGLIWGGIRIVEYYFKFTKVHPTFLIKPWSNPTFNQTTLGYMVGWSAFIVFSVLAALLYTAIFRKIRGHWLGMAYGLAWWVILYVAVGPPMGMMKPIGTIDWISILTDGCLFLLWGFFIGHTIGFEFTDEQDREPSLSIGQA
jgi:hypothetical protein